MSFGEPLQMRDGFVMYAGKKTLEKCQPTIEFEFHSNLIEDELHVSSVDMFNNLFDMGYKLYAIDEFDSREPRKIITQDNMYTIMKELGRAVDILGIPSL